MQGEKHKAHRVGWLRALVLGANDGVVSVSSLITGVVAGGAGRDTVLLSGVAGLVAGAISMAAGEYVSVQSQADTESADLAIERQELKQNPGKELEELSEIYVKRGLEPKLAIEVAVKLTEFDALGAHARDELGITEELSARPIQAAVVSAIAFSSGAAVPVLAAFLAPIAYITYYVISATLAALIVLGGSAAKLGGASIWIGALRVVFWGAIAMLITSFAGQFFGVNV